MRKTKPAMSEKIGLIIFEESGVANINAVAKCRVLGELTMKTTRYLEENISRRNVKVVVDKQKGVGSFMKIRNHRNNRAGLIRV